MKRNHNDCITGKTGYVTKAAAIRAAKYMAQKKTGARKVKMRAYPCHHCKDHHLTKEDRDQYRSDAKYRERKKRAYNRKGNRQWT